MLDAPPQSGERADISLEDRLSIRMHGLGIVPSVDVHGGTVEVFYVLPGSPAQASGFKGGERIRAIDGITDVDGIYERLMPPPGQSVELRVLAGGAQRTVSVRSGAFTIRPEAGLLATSPATPLDFDQVLARLAERPRRAVDLLLSGGHRGAQAIADALLASDAADPDGLMIRGLGKLAAIAMWDPGVWEAPDAGGIAGRVEEAFEDLHAAADLDPGRRNQIADLVWLLALSRLEARLASGDYITLREPRIPASYFPEGLFITGPAPSIVLNFTPKLDPSASARWRMNLVAASDKALDREHVATALFLHAMLASSVYGDTPLRYLSNADYIARLADWAGQDSARCDKVSAAAADYMGTGDFGQWLLETPGTPLLATLEQLWSHGGETSQALFRRQPLAPATVRRASFREAVLYQGELMLAVMGGLRAVEADLVDLADAPNREIARRFAALPWDPIRLSAARNGNPSVDMQLELYGMMLLGPRGTLGSGTAVPTMDCIASAQLIEAEDGGRRYAFLIAEADQLPALHGDIARVLGAPVDLYPSVESVLGHERAMQLGAQARHMVAFGSLGDDGQWQVAMSPFSQLMQQGLQLVGPPS